jgi:large subunit ribosomal protein L7e
LVVVRIRGVKDISRQQSLTLNKLGLREVNTAVLQKVTQQLLTTLKTVENYITWGEPSKKIVSELFYKKAYGKVNNERVQIKSNELIEKQIGGEILCFEDIINEVMNVGKQFNQIKEFIYPFKLTTPEGLLMSRLRKPVGKDGHWGYRGEEINNYIEAMI